MKTEKKPKSERQAELTKWIKENEVSLVKRNAGPVAARRLCKSDGIDPKGLSFRQAIEDANCQLWKGRKVRQSTAAVLTWKQWERIQGGIRKHASILVGDFADIPVAAALLGQQGVKFVSETTVRNAAASMGWLGSDNKIQPPASAQVGGV